MVGGASHSQVAAKLVAEGCLAHVAGAVQGKMGAQPIVLSELERADAGLSQGGNTMFYPIPPTGVFLDLNGAQATVWFTQGDAGQALSAVESRIKQAYPRTKQLKDEAHPRDPEMRLRALEVDCGNARLALVEIEYPAPGKPANKFLTRVVAQQRRS